MSDQTETTVNKRHTLKQGITYLLIIMLVALGLSVLLARGVISHSAAWRESFMWLVSRPDKSSLLERVPAENLDKYKSRLEKDIAQYRKRLDHYIPRQPYLVVNTANNTFKLMKYDNLIREGICSTGSYTIRPFAEAYQLPA